MRLMNYNIHSGKDSAGRMNLLAIADTLNAFAPDFAFIEEVAVNVATAGNVDEQEYLRQHTGMECHFAQAIPWQGGRYGIALLSRHPVTDVRVYPVPDLQQSLRDKWFEHRVALTCRTVWQDRPLTLVMTHLGLSQGERALGFALLEQLTAQAEGPVILAGDLNTQPQDPLLQPLLQRVQMHSLAYTYPSEKPEIKIDYLLTSPHFHVVEEAPLPSQASDHLALVKTVEWKTQP